MSVLHVVTDNITLSQALLDKIKRLSLSLSAEIKIFVIGHNKFADRHYINNFNALWPDYKQQQVEAAKDLQKRLQADFPNIAIKTLIEKRWFKIIEQTVGKSDYVVLIRQGQDDEIFAAAKAFISQSECNILLLGDKTWPQNIQILGAVDPMHEDDPQALADKMVYRHINRLRKPLNAEQWYLVHSIYIPPLAITHKKEISQIHRQEVSRLAQKLHCPNDHIKYLEGKPEHALTAYMSKHPVSLLVVGSRKHSQWEKWLNGSTVEYLIEHSNADILLAKNL